MDNPERSGFSVGRLDEPECMDGHHAFVGADLGQHCECGENTLTEEDLEELISCPMGVLIASGLALPISAN